MNKSSIVISKNKKIIQIQNIVLVFLAILMFNPTNTFAEDDARIKELNRKLDNLEKLEQNYINKRGANIRQSEIDEIARAKTNVKVMIEMENPMYKDDYPCNLFPQVIDYFMSKKGYTILEAEAEIRSQSDEAKSIFKMIADDIHKKRFEEASTRLVKRQRASQK